MGERVRSPFRYRSRKPIQLKKAPSPPKPNTRSARTLFESTGVFLLLLAYFVFGHGWYVPATLRIEGTAHKRQATLAVLWDSGQGWNRYERRIFHAWTPAPSNGAEGIPVTVRSLGQKNSASLSATVVCSGIRIDGREVDFAGISHNGKRTMTGVGLSGPEEALRFLASAAEHIRIELLTNNHSGKVEVTVGGRPSVVDLYMANEEAKRTHLDYWVVQPDGRFAVTMDLPRYGIESLEIHNFEPLRYVTLHSVSVNSEKGIENLEPPPEGVLHRTAFGDVNAGLKEHFSAFQIGVQILLAALLTWTWVRIRSTVEGCGGLRGALVEGQRWLFWTLFAFPVVFYSIWLITFWPGILSVDSLKVWRAALLPDVMINDHPLLFVVLYTGLQQLWQHVAVVPIFHIAATALLLASVAFVLYREGISLKLLLPFYGFVVVSIPVGLYNLALWKDIPFALLVVFSGFVLAVMVRRRKEGTPGFSYHQRLALLLMFVSLCFIRHNGLVYVIAVPGLLVLCRLVSLKWAAVGLLVAVMATASLFAMLRGSSSVADADYVIRMTKRYLKPALDKSMPQSLERIARQYWGILDINQDESKWDLWHYYLEDREAYRFLRHAGWDDVYPYLGEQPVLFPGLRDRAMALYWKTYKTPWVYLTWNPVYLLVLFPLTILLFRWFPLSAVFSAMILIQVLALLGILNILNWRYYYFAYLGALFLPFMILWDLQRLRSSTGDP